MNADSGNAGLRRALAEALFERGHRDEGLSELEMAMIGFERASNLDGASSVADEIIRLTRTRSATTRSASSTRSARNDRTRLVDAYLELADALFRSGQADKARTVYQRVLELAPEEIRAQAALSAFIDPTAAPNAARKPQPAPDRKSVGTPERSGVLRRYTGESKREPSRSRRRSSRRSRPTPPASSTSATGCATTTSRSPRAWSSTSRSRPATRTPTSPTCCATFKQGVAQNVEEEDHEAHYDLGVAYKEMGLLDEAIAEFQKALRGPHNRVRAYEALGQCFLEKAQFQVAATHPLSARSSSRASTTTSSSACSTSSATATRRCSSGRRRWCTTSASSPSTSSSVT